MKTPQEIVTLMLQNDAFSHWMGVELVDIGLGTCELKMQVTEDMLNGFYITHGGISYSFADSAFAFASNSRGYKAVSVETSISHLRKTVAGDFLIAKAVEKHRGRTIGVYEVTVTNQDEKIVALFKGMVHISEEKW
jgi:acyl-CoA thioesterase